MYKDRKKRYWESGTRLVQHLDTVLHPETGYPDMPSWGYAVTYLAALTAQNGESTLLSEKARNLLNLQDKEHPNYSWEFVVYALQAAKGISTNSISNSIDGYRAKGTRMFNWFLLRQLNKQLCNVYSPTAKLQLWVASKIYQEPCGLILDEFKTRSLQYHAFCLFLLAELIEINPNIAWMQQWFTRGIEFSIKQTLKDGTALYMGRGQEQIFGYAALIYSLEYCHTKIQRLNEGTLDRISNKLLDFQRDDGSFPLVLRHRDPEQPNISFSKDQPAGWYGYNTLYDYQPFLAYCMLKAGKLP